MTKRIISNLFLFGAVALVAVMVIGSVGAFECGNIGFFRMIAQMVIGGLAAYGCMALAIVNEGEKR